MEVVEAHPFRVTRDADIAIQELEAEDLLETIEEGVRRRRFGSVVRVTVTPSLPDFVRDTLAENLKLDPEDLVIVKPPIGASNLMELYKIDRPDLKDPAFRPALLPGFDDAENPDMFAAIREHDILLHRPFDSFEPFVKLLQQAAEDPDVLAIKMTLYRVGRDSPVVEALLDAAENGKEVAALVELKARFDEESNIGWARKLEQAGVHVVYGVLGLKTHSKVALIVRKEGDRVRRYLHLGTGNYNVATALQYTDLDLLITDEVMGEDASELFNFLTGYAEQDSYESFLVAPVTIRQGFEALVRREMDLARAGRPARMILKMNSLVDRAMVRILYEASQAGVQDRPDRAGDVHPEAGVAGSQRQHHRHEHRRQVPRAHADLLLRERRRPDGSHRQRRPDAAKPGSARRGAGPRQRSRADSAVARGDPADLPR